MGKYIKLVIGAFLILSAVVGGFNIANGGMQEAGRRIVENGTDTVGIVEKRTQHIVGAKIGKAAGLGAYYTMSYNFTTLEGVKYGGQINVTKEQAYAIEDGQEIRIRYHANQPSINAPLDFKEYMTEEDIGNVPVGAILVAMASMVLGGAWLVWSGWAAIRPTPGIQTSSRFNKIAVQSNTPSKARQAAAVGGPKGKQMFGKS